MEKEQIVSRLIDEIDIPSDKFGLAYDIIEYCVDSMLRDFQKENDLLEEYVQFARLHIETYRCKCGSLGRVGYLCSNKECSEE